MKASTTRRRIISLRTACALVATAGAWLATPAPAAEAPAADAAEFGELLNVMSEETDVATRTRMNSDFVPGIVTVLDGDHLAALGARTVWDALPFVPGVQAARDPRGTSTSMVRGMPFPFNNGNILVLLNGVPMGRDSAGVNTAGLDFPIAQVDRIEFVRGPGSVVYGEYALQGVVNIVTRDEGSAIAVEGDSRNSPAGHLRSAGKAGDWQLAANLSAEQSDKAPVTEGNTASDAHRFGVLSAKRGGFALNLQGIEHNQDDNDGKPPNLNDAEHSGSVDASYRHDLADKLEVRLRSQYLSNRFDNNNTVFIGEQVRSGAELLWSGWEHQSWLAGIEFTDGTIDHARFVPPPPPPPAPPPPPVVIGNKYRNVLGLVLQDQVAITDNAEFTVGARWDDNSEAGKRVTPRAAIVYRINDHHIVKAQYSEGYRSPTFFELYTNPAQPPLSFEVNATGEINYVYQAPGTTARATVFQSRLHDMIFLDPVTHVFANGSQANSHGVELELTQQLASTLRMDANLSTARSEDDRNLQQSMQGITAAPSWMGNLGLLWTPFHDTLFGLAWNHVGPRRSAPDGYQDFDLVNLTFTRRNLLANGLDFRAGVSNAFDRRVVYMEPATFGDVPLAYQDRTTWVGVTWRLR